MDDIKILVCCHKPCHIHKGDLYLPIQVGKAINDIDLGIQTDDSVNNIKCDNISDLNHLYCETTAMYWAWRNIRILYPEIKYIGLCHYRRYFSSENHTGRDFLRTAKRKLICIGKTAFSYHNHTCLLDPRYSIKLSEKSRFLKSDEGLRTLILSADLVTTNPVKVINGTVEDFFNIIGRDYINLMKQIVKVYFEQYYDSLIDVLNGSELNAANMIILKTDFLDEYCEYLFGVLDMHMRFVKNSGLVNDPLNEKIYSRIPGYLAELITCSFVQYKRKNSHVKFASKFFVEE